MQEIRISVMVVCLNPGDKIIQTIDSVLAQDYVHWEIVVKDGLSRENVEELLPKDPRIRYVRREDGGIYDAMNQAAEHATGDYIYYLNCGDRLHGAKVFSEVVEAIKTWITENAPGIVYGDIMNESLQAKVTSPATISRFTSYRNLPCHQAYFTRSDLLKERGFLTQYRVRADYEHFLWVYLHKKEKLCYVPVTVAIYEGGGYSETKANLQRSKEEHGIIARQYYSRTQRAWYQFLLLLTLAPLRRKLAQSSWGSRLYHRLLGMFYRKKHKG